MNWYKTATRNIKFPPEEDYQLREVASLMRHFYFRNKKPPNIPTRFYTIKFHNRFYDIDIKTDIYFNNEFVETTKHGGFLDLDGSIKLNFYMTGFRASSDEKTEVMENIEKSHYSVIIHEMDHAIYEEIKKKRVLNWDRKREFSKKYEERPAEFEAYAKEVIETLKNLPEDETKDVFKKFLETGKMFYVKNYISNDLYKIVFYWFINRKDLFKKLLMRIYNEVINENNTK